MQKLKSIQINIPHPCTQNWDEMTNATHGRHCAHCAKNVIDFTSYTDAALYHFFEKNPANVCGRFNSTQVNRPISIPYQPNSRLYRMAVAMGLTLMFTQTPQLLAQNRPPLTEQNALLKASDRKVSATPDSSGRISGTVLDEKKEPLINAVVQAFQNGVLKGGNVTDYDGNYTISPLAPGKYDIHASYTGFDTLLIVDVPAGDNITRLNISMKNPRHKRIVEEISFWVGQVSILSDNPSQKTFTRREIEHMGH